jgi:drug/metabolite transporter (DMT)-like permease
MNNNQKGILLLLLATVGFGIIPIMAKLAYDQGANAVTVLAFRFLIASAFFLAYIGIKGISMRVDSRTFLTILAFSALCYGVQCLLFFSAFQYIPPAIGELLFYIYPVFVLVGSYFFFREKPSGKIIFCVFLSMAGCALVLWAPWNHLEIKGLALIVLAALACATYTLGSKKLLATVGPIVLAAYSALGCSAFFLIYGGLTGTLRFNLSITTMGIIALLSCWSTVIGMFAFLAGLSLIGATRASIIGTFEPIVTIALSYLFLNSGIRFMQLMGGALIIASILWMVSRDGKPASPEGSGS